MDKPPYKLTIKLDGAKPERVAEALTQLRETAAMYDQTGDASATLTIEAHQERPLHALIDAFEEWLYAHAQGLDVDIKLQRPGIRPETMAMRAREKRTTPMDVLLDQTTGERAKEWAENTRRLHVVPRDEQTPGERALDWLEAREQD
jgi:hypothetical protein